MSKDTFKKILWLIAFAVVLYLSLQNLSGLGVFLKTMLGVLSPLLLGIILAFLLNIPLKFLEERAFSRLWKKCPKLAKGKRGICMVLTYVLVIAILVVISVFTITQVSDSVSKFAAHLPDYMVNAEKFISEMAVKIGLEEEIWRGWIEKLGSFWNLVSTYASDAVSIVYKIISSVTSGLFAVLVGLIFSVYALASKERLASILRRLKLAYIPQKAIPYLNRVGSEASSNLTKFFGGQLIEALIIGVLCLIGILILGIPYAPLVSTVVGITNIIPIFGPWIGGGFAAVIILLESPVKALVFLIFVVALQQFESNLIYPRVVGKAVGLPGIWVFVAITIGGGLFGLLGMLFAVPVMATVYGLLASATQTRLEKKNSSVKKAVAPDPPAPPSKSKG